MADGSQGYEGGMQLASGGLLLVIGLLQLLALVRTVLARLVRRKERRSWVDIWTSSD